MKVRLKKQVSKNTLIYVSIHAPVKVRLEAEKVEIEAKGVSIHAPVKVRLALIVGLSRLDLFQSTHP